jgi:hypothetical protein
MIVAGVLTGWKPIPHLWQEREKQKVPFVSGVDPGEKAGPSKDHES